MLDSRVSAKVEEPSRSASEMRYCKASEREREREDLGPFFTAYPAQGNFVRRLSFFGHRARGALFLAAFWSVARYRLIIAFLSKRGRAIIKIDRF